MSDSPTGYCAIQVFPLQPTETPEDASYRSLPVISWLEPVTDEETNQTYVRAYVDDRSGIFVVKEWEDGWHFFVYPNLPRERLQKLALDLRQEAGKADGDIDD